jgi:hypothetical protein
MLTKLTPMSLIVLICLSVFLVMRTMAAFNGATSAHNILGIGGLATIVVGMLLGGGQSYKFDQLQNRTKADILLGIGFLALLVSYGMRYLGR